MVWIVEWSQPEQYDHKVTTFTTEADALSTACYDIMNDVMNWDLCDSEISEAARRINDYVSVGDYRNAIREYNDVAQDIVGDEYAMYWHVYESKPIIGGKKPNTIIFQDPDEDEEEEDDEEEDIPETPWVAATPGATCRGPSCGQHNEYAYADRRDGTYVCHSCKMMLQVFGGKAP